MARDFFATGLEPRRHSEVNSRGRGRGRGDGRGRGRGGGQGRGRGRGRGRGQGDRPSPKDEDDEAYDELLLLDDGVQELTVKTPSYPAMILGSASMPASDVVLSQDQPEKKIGRLFAKEGLVIRVRFHDDAHSAHCAVRLAYHLGNDTNITAVVRFNIDAIEGGATTLEKVPETEHGKYLGEEEVVEAGLALYRFQIPAYVPGKLSAENLFTTTTGPGDVFKDVRDLFTSNATSFTCILYATGNLENHHQDFSDALRKELDEFISQQLSVFSSWYPYHPTRLSIQAGDYPAEGSRPNYPYPGAKHAFFNFEEYFTVQAFGIIKEHELVEATRKESHLVDLKTFTIPGCSDRRFMGFLSFEVGITPLRLEAGDRLQLNFDPETDIWSENWSAYVLNAHPFATVRETTIMLDRPWDKEKHEYFDKSILAATTLTHSETARAEIAETRCYKVKMQLIDSDKHFRRQLNTLQRLPTALSLNSDLEASLLANAPSFLSKKNMLERRLSTTPNIEQEIGLSANQIECVLTYRENPGPIAMLQGPPGTGKTYVAARLLLALLEAEPSQKVLVVAPMNAPVDAITVHVNKMLESSNKTAFMVIRLHTMGTETKVIRKEADKGRAPNARSPPSVNDEETLEKDLAATVYAQAMHDFYNANTRDKFKHGIGDERLQMIDLSLGMWMLRVAGLIDAESPFNRSQDFVEFLGLYRQYIRDVLAADNMPSFRLEFRRLREYTLGMAHVVCCTLSQCAESAVYSYFRPSFTIIEEASRALEVDCLMPLVFYRSDTTLLLGDDKQFPPTVLSSLQEGNNFFAPQLHNSLFNRLKHAGFPCPSLNENRRMQVLNAELIQTIFYRQELPTFATPVRRFADETNRICTFNQIHFKKKTPIMWLNMPKGEAQVLPAIQSKFNVVNAAFSVNLLINLIESNTAASDDIVILTPYNAQHNLYTSAIQDVRQNSNLPLAGLTIAKIDGFQSNERKVVILDLVVTQKLGFVRFPYRLNVALSRAQCGLYILGDIGAMEKNRERKCKWLVKVSNFCREKHAWWSNRDVTTSSHVTAALTRMELQLPDIDHNSVTSKDHTQ